MAVISISLAAMLSLSIVFYFDYSARQDRAGGTGSEELKEELKELGKRVKALEEAVERLEDEAGARPPRSDQGGMGQRSGAASGSEEVDTEDSMRGPPLPRLKSAPARAADAPDTQNDGSDQEAQESSRVSSRETTTVSAGDIE